MIAGKEIAMIVAMDKKGAIGKGGDLPWHIPDDLKFFKAQTLGKTIVMGRKTFESIGRPLPGRTTVILTRDSKYRRDGCLVACSLEEAAEQAVDDTVIIAGGGEIYRRAMSYADRLIVTHVDLVVDGDTRFPSIEKDQWIEINREEKPDSKTGIGLAFVIYERP